MSFESPRDRIRWIPVRNMQDGKEGRAKLTIPGFALMMLNVADRDRYFTQDREDGAVVFRVYRPDAEAQARQDPAMLIVNGPTPIPPGKDGKGTQDWPAQVLHNGAEDSLPNGVPCGPIADSFYVWSGLSAFTCQSHDICRAAPGKENGIHTVWISPGRPNLTPLSILIGGENVEADAQVGLEQPSSVQLGHESSVPRAIVDTWIRAAGYYLVSVSATLSSTEADEGDVLRLRVFYRTKSIADGDGSWTATYLTGHRKQEVDRDVLTESPLTQSTFYTAENVAFSGTILLPGTLFGLDSGGYPKWVELGLFNKSLSTITVADAIFSVVSLGSAFDTTEGTLKYPTSS